MKEKILETIRSYNDLRGNEAHVEFVTEKDDTVTVFFSGSMIDHDPDAHITDFMYEYEELSNETLRIKSHTVKNDGYEVVFERV